MSYKKSLSSDVNVRERWQHVDGSAWRVEKIDSENDFVHLSGPGPCRSMRVEGGHDFFTFYKCIETDDRFAHMKVEFNGGVTNPYETPTREEVASPLERALVEAVEQATAQAGAPTETEEDPIAEEDLVAADREMAKHFRFSQKRDRDDPRFDFVIVRIPNASYFDAKTTPQAEVQFKGERARWRFVRFALLSAMNIADMFGGGEDSIFATVCSVLIKEARVREAAVDERSEGED